MLTDDSQLKQLSQEQVDKNLHYLSYLGKVYQKHLSKDTPVYVTGSVALHRATAPREAWNFSDMDTLVPNTRIDNLDKRVKQVEHACLELNGKFHSIYFALHQQSDIGMRDVLAKGVCKLNNSGDAINTNVKLIPKISTIFSSDSVVQHLKNCKAPSVIVYPADDPSKFLVPDNRWLKNLRQKYLPKGLYNDDTSDNKGNKLSRDTFNKYVPRGYLLNASSASNPFGDVDINNNVDVKANNQDNTQANTAYTAPISASSPVSSAPELSLSLAKDIKEQEWRSAVTAKIHYRAGAAWRNLRIGQGVGMIGLGLGFGLGLTFNKSLPKNKLLHFSLTAVPIGLGLYIIEQPSQCAKQHQIAGAGYSGLENEWKYLHNKLVNKRIRYDIAESQTLYLLREKAKLDKRSPNAPEFWKRGVIDQIKHKYV